MLGGRYTRHGYRYEFCAWGCLGRRARGVEAVGAAAACGGSNRGLILCRVWMVCRALWSAEMARGGHSVMQDVLGRSGPRVALTRRARVGDSECGRPAREQEGARTA